MQVVVILAHPRPGSFSHAIADTAVARLKALGHEVILHDLYREQFNPVMPPGEINNRPTDPDMLPYLAEVGTADAFVIVHPNWWGQPPAILKGWVDRVLCSGVAYAFLPDDNTSGVPVGLLRAHVAVVFNTSNTPAEREAEVFGDPLEALWKKCIFRYCGVERFLRRTFSTIAGSTETARNGWLNEVENTIQAEFSSVVMSDT